MKGTLFDKAGGFARVRLIVSELYDKILDSEQLCSYFEHADMRRLIDHQTKFVAALMGGPVSFTNEQLDRAHRRLGIREEHFEEMAVLFRETLEDFGLDPHAAARLEAHMLSLREHIVGARPAETS